MKPTPLTDEEIKTALVQVDSETKRLPPGFRDFARAIEAAVNAKWEREVAMMKVSQFAQEQEQATIKQSLPVEIPDHKVEGSLAEFDRYIAGDR